jgi:DNA (cytosine-5)-methyltransferase 1
MQPKWIVWENVPGVLSSGKGRDFGTFLGALGELGYGFAYRVLDAQWFGVAQRRRRVFVVGHLGDWRRAAAVLFERESVFGNPPTRGATGEGTAVAASIRTKTGRSDDRGDGCDNLVAAYGFKQGANHSGACGGLTEDCEPPLTCGQDHNLIAFHPTQDPISSDDGSTHAMGCGSKGGCCTQAVAFSHSAAANSHGVAYVEEGTPPLRGGGAGNSMPAVAQAMAVRRLTPRECERLQGFPDDYTLVEYRKKPAADGPRYRALGNSMAVPVMRWIGERIAMVDRMA